MIITDPVAEINPELYETLQSEIEALNTQLENDSYDNAEQAFSISCFMSIFIIIILTIVLLIVSRWQTAGIVFLMAVTLALSVSSWLALRARAGNIKNTFKLIIAPKIETLIKDFGINKDQFDTLVYQLLPDGAPILAFIPRPVRMEDSDDPIETDRSLQEKDE